MQITAYLHRRRNSHYKEKLGSVWPSLRTRTPRQQYRHRNPFYVIPTVRHLQVRQGAEAGECPEFQRLQAVPIQVPVDASVWGD